jgi:hypothetical protein
VLGVLDVLFHVIHLSFIVINLTFWMSFRTLRIAQITLLLTLISWFGFGIFYGFGYCFLTDWHWQVKESLGEKNLPLSYVKYILDKVTGSDLNADMIDKGTMAALLIAVTGCVVQSIRSYNRSGPR